MNNTKGIPTPENWLIDTGIKTYWPLAEGIWINKESEPMLRVGCVYHSLMDIPEAAADLNRCNELVIAENGKSIDQFYNPIITQVKAGKQFFIKDEDFINYNYDRISDIYREWVNRWALGSEKMLAFAGALNFYNSILSYLGLSNRSTRRILQERLIQLSKRSNHPSGILAWETLFSAEYRRIDETNRELARRKVQDLGFNRIRERVLLTAARYWTMIRILGYGELELILKLGLNIEQSNFSTKVLKPFDNALLPQEKRPGPGRPLGSKTLGKSKDVDEIADALLELELK
jgi:hypothetical protein